MRSYDVVIVGAGLAGLSAAVAMATGSDAAIALVERRGIGSNSPTPLTFVDVVKRFDLGGYVSGRYRRFTFHSPLGNRSSHAYDEPVLAALDYSGACAELLRRGHAAGDITVISTAASGLQRGGDGHWQVHTAAGKTITTPLLIDASGRGSFATRALGLPGPRMFSHCYGQVLGGCAVPDPEESFYLAPSDRFGDGGGWLYPLSDGRVSFGFAMLSADADYPRQALQERYHRALHEFPPYAEWLVGAHVDHVERGTIPICPPRRFVYDGLMLVGDAAGQATIWTCMGSEPALVSGELAGRAASKAYHRQDYSRVTLQSYQWQWDRAYRRIYRQGALLAPVSWGQGEISWNKQIPLVQQLDSQQMLARLRTNWPLLPWWKVAFIRGYDWAGRVRRSLANRIGSAWRRGRQ